MNFTGDHNLNLIGKVAVVISCSTPLGAAISRSLLNSNAFVLGIDEHQPHKSTESSKASHFQFLRRGEGELETVGRERFGGREVDFLVVVGDEEGGGGEEVRRVREVMIGRGEGVVLRVLSAEEGKREGELLAARFEAEKFKRSGVRYNILISQPTERSETWESILDSQTKEALDAHVKEHDDKRKKGGYKVEKEREVANLALFLCTKAGSGINSALVGIDGNVVGL